MDYQIPHENEKLLLPFPHVEFYSEMEVLSVKVAGKILQVGSDYISRDEDDLEFPFRLVRLHPSKPQSLLIRIWRLVSSRWELNPKGPRPHPRRVFLEEEERECPTKIILGPADVVHETVFRQIPTELQGASFFFSHIQANKVLKRVSSKHHIAIPNEATHLRLVGTILRRRIMSFLSKRNRFHGKDTLAFPVGHELVLQSLEEIPHFQKGKTVTFRLTNPSNLDYLCGGGWDFYLFQSDGRAHVVTCLEIRKRVGGKFVLALKFCLEGGLNISTYREKTRQYFH